MERMRLTGVCRLALLLLFPLCLSAAASPSYTIETIPNVRLADRNNYVSNPDGIIRPDDAARINSLLRTVEDSLGIEIAVVAVKSIGDNDARMFATDLFQYWKPGKKGKDNGLLIQLVTDPPQRSVVFETGYGLEGVLPDAICYRMQQRYMLPDFKAGDYSAGMLKGVEAVKNYLMASDYERASIVGDEQEMDDEEFFEIIGIFLIIFILSALIACLIRSSYMHRPRVCPRCGQKTLVYAGRQVLRRATYDSEGLVEELWRCKNCGYTEKKNRTTDRLQRNDTPIIFGNTTPGSSWGGSGGSWGGGASGGGGSISRW